MMVMVMMTPVMSAMVVRRLRLRNRRCQQEQEQRSKQELFHSFKSNPQDDSPKSKIQRGQSQ
jgi:hypothetical protein